ncbi:MAG TPA: Asp-tRNA(Asn)/Glu-tRNA(Gln) amidotransferase subunit GatA [Opitutaceae bacterium]|jgi:aspartyl-tRNA(Asn)/glutamyl-tRNA(Gln) amidotransferase subunit A
MAEPLYYRSIAELATGLAVREFSSEELTRTVIARTEDLEPQVQAFNSRDQEYALNQAREADERHRRGIAASPLDGVPIGLKDVIAVQDQPLTASSRMLANFVSPYDSTTTVRLKQAGAVLWGRLNLDEFAMGSSTENSGSRRAGQPWQTRNPWDLSRVPGGSSGGSAASVACGEVIASLGSDTGGSIRQPAALCGIVGMKPTYGLVSRYGLIAFASSLDQIGPFARSVEDAAILLGAIAGHDPLDSTSVDAPKVDYRAELKRQRGPWKLGVAKEYFSEGLGREVGDAVSRAIDYYRSIGCEIREVSLPHTKYAVGVYYIIATAECSSNLARYDGVRYGHRANDAESVLDLYFRSRAEGFGDEVKRRIILGTYVLSSGYYDAYYLRAQKVRTLMRDDFVNAFQEVDAIITPTSPTVAFKRGATASPLEMYLNDIYTIGANLAGLPAISLPCGLDREHGLPIGLQIIGPAFQEARLLSIANAYEQGHDWNRRRPGGVPA